MPTPCVEQRTLTLGELSISFTWERKTVKNYNLRVRRDGSIYVSTPRRITVAQMERFLTDKQDFLRRALARTAARSPLKCLSLLEGEQVPIFGVLHTVCHVKEKKCRVWCEDGRLMLAMPHPQDTAMRLRAFWRFAQSSVEALMQALTATYKTFFLGAEAPLPALSLRRMKSRWGSCFYRENRINYNTNLIFAPRDCARYVVCHELAHFCHHDHSKAFYDCLARVMPDHATWRQVLRSTVIPVFCDTET